MVFFLLPLMLLPWFSHNQDKTIVWSYFVPIDPLSKVIGLIRKALASLVFVCLILSLAGPYIPEQKVERIGNGAEVVILVDRSRSMDDPFSSREKAVAASRTVGKANSKRRIAKKYLLEFVNKRPDDRFGFVLFSGKAMDLLPLSYSKDSIRAMINASALGKGLSETNIAKAMIKAAEMYAKETYHGSRTVLLVSDGGQKFSVADEQAISMLYKRENLKLYWIYMGSIRDLNLDTEGKDHLWDDAPERKVHAFFQSLGATYRIFEVESVENFSDALDEIDKQEHQTLIVEEIMPRETRIASFLWIAMMAMLLLALAQVYTLWGTVERNVDG